MNFQTKYSKASNGKTLSTLVDACWSNYQQVGARVLAPNNNKSTYINIMAKKCNQKRLPSEKKSGQFYQMFTRITNDNRLTGNAHWILCSILSNAPTFNISSIALQKRLGLGKDAVSAGFVVLEECGYVRRTKLPRGFFYEISEYGNLNNEPSVEVVLTEPKQNKIVDVKPTKVVGFNQAYSDATLKYITLNRNYLDEKIVQLFIGISEKHYGDFHAFKSDADKVINKYKTKYYNECLADVKLSSCTKEGQTIFKEWLKTEIYDENKIDIDYKKKLRFLSSKYPVKFKTDVETEYMDRMENPED